MNTEKISNASDRLREVKQLLVEAGVAPHGSVIRQLEDLSATLDLFARSASRQAA